jgi:hypothetical protein
MIYAFLVIEGPRLPEPSTRAILSMTKCIRHNLMR